jgi:hypothetical protein
MPPQKADHWTLVLHALVPEEVLAGNVDYLERTPLIEPVSLDG